MKCCISCILILISEVVVCIFKLVCKYKYLYLNCDKKYHVPELQRVRIPDTQPGLAWIPWMWVELHKVITCRCWLVTLSVLECFYTNWVVPESFHTSPMKQIFCLTSPAPTHMEISIKLQTFLYICWSSMEHLQEIPISSAGESWVDFFLELHNQD